MRRMKVFGKKSGKHALGSKSFSDSDLKSSQYRISRANTKHIRIHRAGNDEIKYEGVKIPHQGQNVRTPSSRASDLVFPNTQSSEYMSKTPQRRSNMRRKKSKSKLSKPLIAILAVILIIILAVYVVAKAMFSPPKLETPAIISNSTDINGEVISTGETHSDDTYIDVSGTEGYTRKEGYYTILVACTDEDETRTDSIIVCSFDATNDKISLINIPRDTMSNVNRNLRKINSAYSVGKVKQLKKEINMLLGIPVDRYIIFNFDGIAEVVDALGGITFDVPVKMNYDDPTQDLRIHYSKGEQLLKGQDVVNVLRFRKNNNGTGYADADIGRIETLHKFAKTLANRLTSPSVITKVPSIAKATLKNTNTDLTLSDATWFVSEGLSMTTESVETFTLPGYDKTVYEPSLGYTQSYWIPKKSEILELINGSFNPFEEEIVKLNVVSSSNISRGETPSTTKKTTEKDQEETTQSSKSTLAQTKSDSTTSNTESSEPTATDEPLDTQTENTNESEYTTETSNETTPTETDENQYTETEEQTENTTEETYTWDTATESQANDTTQSPVIPEPTESTQVSPSEDEQGSPVV